ncbi:anthranilate synthase component I family protein [Pedobacter metabolipauper]|uniref:Para-aminobenzoate synthetase component 1 n=1 Tax=Pedobacter metabolipauper TaxID=425513 RepID=A0A4R6SSJ5_9SPHI|nr:anthranilate synthase component I family protein [Pedobacter metabolipauper]TDQ06873.1 para-aminobenzoate synthetase component 1 [Pedobacter metabolipauper]
MKVQDLHVFKQQALQWANTFDVCCCLDSNHYADAYGEFDFMLAVGADQSIHAETGSAFEALKSFYERHKNWMFGLLSYDLKNEVESLSSSNPDRLLFPDLYFFIPKYLIVIRNGELEIIIGDSSILELITNTRLKETVSQDISIQSRISKEDYLDTINKLKQHIVQGDIYEVNFCQEFFAEHAEIDPLAVYHKLNELSPTPFSGFFKINEQYILSASPERYLRKIGDQLISQPIKGTARRSTNEQEDRVIRANLKKDAKEQAENVMIVDLVRNDLTKTAAKGSVKVEELFGIYGFPQVYQMISTISSRLDPGIHFIDAIKNSFPMGSMTGAPKIKAMNLIEQYESSKRGAYSGALGYLAPSGNFDFNVIIRSILYQSASKYLSFQVGGAITYACVAENEYEECLLKASPIIKTLKGPHKQPS